MKRNLRLHRILSLTTLLFFLLGGGYKAMAQKTLPYSYGFENNDLAGEGWSINNGNGTSTGIKSISGQAYSGSRYFTFASSNEYNPQYLISPELECCDDGIYVKLYYRCSSAYDMTFKIGYSTSDSPTNMEDDFTWPSNAIITTQSTIYNNAIIHLPYSNIKFIALQYDHNVNYRYMYFDNISIYCNSYLAPRDLTASAIVTSASLTWEKGSSESNWLIYYSTSSTDPAENLTEIGDNVKAANSIPTYSFTELTEGTTYYAWVRSNYGEGNFSTWTGPVTMEASSIKTLVANDGTTNVYNAPFYGYGADKTTNKCQYIIPSNELNDMVGMEISKLTYYTTIANKSFGDATFKIYLKEVENTTFSTTDFESFSEENVYYNGSVSSNANKVMDITLSKVYQYNGGNLMIYFCLVNTGTSNNCTFYGISTSPNYVALYQYGTNSASRYQYSPKTTFTYTYPKTLDSDGNWTTGSGAPAATDNVLLQGNITIASGTNATAHTIDIDQGSLTIASGGILTCNNVNAVGGNLTIADGAQLICNNSVAATVNKTIADAGAKDAANHWYTISSPVHEGTENYVTINNTNTVNLTADSYDMFAYDEATSKWLNQKALGEAAGFTQMNKAQGYLYRNSGNELSYIGNTTVGNQTVALTKTDAQGTLAGLNLIGNPFPHNIYKGKDAAIDEASLSEKFYYLNDNGTWQLGTYTTPILPGTGIIVQANTAGDITIKDITTAASAEKAVNNEVMFTIANSQYEDVAYAEFNGGYGLYKMSHPSEDAPMLYIAQNDKNYAVAKLSETTQSFNLNLKAITMGKYTLSAKAMGDFNYLHVIDRLTGEDIDMLLEGEYSFMASPTDNENRFIVKLEYSDGSDNSDSTFAYQSGNDIVVNGEGELQVFDVMGRMMMSQRVNGVETINVPTDGVYIFRLNEKVQKIVVE